MIQGGNKAKKSGKRVFFFTEPESEDKMESQPKVVSQNQSSAMEDAKKKKQLIFDYSDIIANSIKTKRTTEKIEQPKYQEQDLPIVFKAPSPQIQASKQTPKYESAQSLFSKYLKNKQTEQKEREGDKTKQYKREGSRPKVSSSKEPIVKLQHQQDFIAAFKYNTAHEPSGNNNKIFVAKDSADVQISPIQQKKSIIIMEDQPNIFWQQPPKIDGESIFSQKNTKTVYPNLFSPQLKFTIPKSGQSQPIKPPQHTLLPQQNQQPQPQSQPQTQPPNPYFPNQHPQTQSQSQPQPPCAQPPHPQQCQNPPYHQQHTQTQEQPLQQLVLPMLPLVDGVRYQTIILQQACIAIAQRQLAINRYNDYLNDKFKPNKPNISQPQQQLYHQYQDQHQHQYQYSQYPQQQQYIKQLLQLIQQQCKLSKYQQQQLIKQTINVHNDVQLEYKLSCKYKQLYNLLHEQVLRQDRAILQLEYQNQMLGQQVEQLEQAREKEGEKEENEERGEDIFSRVDRLQAQIQALEGARAQSKAKDTQGQAQGISLQIYYIHQLLARAEHLISLFDTELSQCG